jgi:hypothetical protein
MGQTYKTRFAVVSALDIDNIIEPPLERIQEMEEKNGFFSKLEKSILEEGFRNPIVLTSKNDRLTPRYGGSRIMIAQKHKMDIPAIIADFDDRFSNAEILSDANKIRSKFKDQPKSIHYKPHGINISGCKDIHLDD